MQIAYSYLKTDTNYKYPRYVFYPYYYIWICVHLRKDGWYIASRIGSLDCHDGVIRHHAWYFAHVRISVSHTTKKSASIEEKETRFGPPYYNERFNTEVNFHFLSEYCSNIFISSKSGLCDIFFSASKKYTPKSPLYSQLHQAMLFSSSAEIISP